MSAVNKPPSLEPSRFREPTTPSLDTFAPHWMDEDALSMLEECRKILSNRCGRRGNGLDNLEILGDLAKNAFLNMSGLHAADAPTLPHYGGVVMIMSKLQRVMTEDLHRDDYVDLINYVLMTYQMRKRAQSEPSNSKAD